MNNNEENKTNMDGVSPEAGKSAEEENLSSSELHRIKGRKRRSVLKAQKRAIIILAVCAVLLGIALGFVTYYVNIITFTDIDGTKYRIKQKNGVYVLCDKEGYTLEQTTDGYYVTAISTLVEVDKDTGAYEQIAIVDTEEGESLGVSQRYLMFPHISQDNTQSVEVHNQYGSFTFYRDADDKFQIKGFEGTPYVPTLFSSLAVSAGYTLTMEKIKDPIKNAEGKYTEYGLAPEKRMDADGNEYDYEPIWYRVADTSGNYYTVYVGDEIPSGAGYYVKYTQRDAVYIMNYSVDGSILSMYDTSTKYESVQCIMNLPVERFVSPVICYPMTLTTYFDVQNFTIIPGEEVKKAEADDKYEIKPVISFSYWDMEERFGTFYHNIPYHLHYPEGYYLNDVLADTALQSFYSMAFLGVTKLGVTDEDLKTYGLDDPSYVMYFNFNDIEHMIYISHMTDRGTYYLTSALYDMIVEVDHSQLLYLEYRTINWVDPNYYYMNLAWATDIIIEAGGDSWTFKVDNSDSDSMSNPTYSESAKEKTTITSDKAKIYCTDSKGNTMQALSEYVITDKEGFTWTITPEKVTAVDSKGEKANIKGGKYETNAIGKEVVVLIGKVVGADGTEVEVGANKLIITKDGHSEVYLRYGTQIFRKFYQSLLYASIDGDVHDGVNGLTDEQISAMTARPDEGLQAKITVKTGYSEVPEYVFRFYPYSERRSMITIDNGIGEFYVLRTFTDKIVADAARVMAGEAVDPISKY